MGICIFINMNMNINRNTYTRVCAFVCKCVHVCMYVCMRVCDRCMNDVETFVFEKCANTCACVCERVLVVYYQCIHHHEVTSRKQKQTKRTQIKISPGHPVDATGPHPCPPLLHLGQSRGSNARDRVRGQGEHCPIDLANPCYHWLHGVLAAKSARRHQSSTATPPASPACHAFCSLSLITAAVVTFFMPVRELLSVEKNICILKNLYMEYMNTIKMT